MSRKHYEETAAALKWALDGLGGKVRQETRRETVVSIAKDLANMFRADNSNFDRAKFMDAAGVGDENDN
jgi:hypothetical protein